MLEIGLFISGMIVGGLGAAALVVARVRGAAAQQRAELQARAAAAESATDELRSQLAEQARGAAELRAALQAEQQQRTAAETRLDESLKSLAQQRALLEQAEQRFKETFEALSSRALRSNNDAFARQAEDKLRPLADALKRYETQLREIENARRTAYGELAEQLKQVGAASQELARRTTSLSTALRSPEVKGQWGELTLRNAVELAGLSPHCDFVEQHSVDGESGRLRPDLLVKLPGGRLVVVDAKAPTAAYMEAVEAVDEAGRRAALERHAQAIRTHMRELGRKGYAEQFERSPDFVVMFIPGESFFAAALEQDGELIAEGLRRNVILASPTTLIALLKTVSQAWQQQQMLENAERIGQTGSELFERVSKFTEHLARIGDQLRRAGEAYDAAIGSWQARVAPAGRRMQELGIKAADGQSLDLEPLNMAPVPVAAPHRPSDSPAADGRAADKPPRPELPQPLFDD